MPLRFLVAPDPPSSQLAQAASLAPWNPFITESFVASRRRLGDRPWLVGLEDDGRLISACAAFMRVGRLNRAVDIVSLPEIADPDLFWDGLRRFCSDQGVSELHLNSFASMRASIPALAGEVARHRRCEYVLDLGEDDPWGGLSPHHRRNVARARKRGLGIQRARDAAACMAHTLLLGASMDRRQHLGESVPTELSSSEPLAMLQAGAGELFQVTGDGHLMSSMLILRASCGAYMHTSGTSPAGMTCGASHLLMYSVACALRAEGVRVFNMGGAAPEQPGLQRFKDDFGARTIDLESASFSFVGSLKQMLTHTAHRLRRNARAMTSGLLDRVQSRRRVTG